MSEHLAEKGAGEQHPRPVEQTEPRNDSNIDTEPQYNHPATPPPHTFGSYDAEGKWYPDGGREAWLVLLGCFCGCFALATLNSLGAFQSWISTHQLKDETAGKISWIFGFYTFMSFFVGLQLGPFFDAYGPRALLLVGSVCLIAMYLILAVCEQYWHFMVTFGFLGGLATSLIFIPSIGAVQHWFLKRRGIATGLAVSGGSVGGVVFPILLNALLPRIGFAWTARAIALLFLPFLILASLLVKARFKARRKSKFTFPNLRVLLSTTNLIVTAGIFFMEWGMFVPMTYITSYALEHGAASSTAFYLLSYVSACSVAGRLIPGYFGDKIGQFNTQVLSLSLCMIATLAMWLPAGDNIGLVIAFCCIAGFATGSNISLTPTCLAKLCSTEHFGNFYGATYTLASVAALTSIPVAGNLLDAADGQYWGLIIFNGATYGVAMLCFAFVRLRVAGWNIRAKF